PIFACCGGLVESGLQERYGLIEMEEGVAEKGVQVLGGKWVSALDPNFGKQKMLQIDKFQVSTKGGGHMDFIISRSCIKFTWRTTREFSSVASVYAPAILHKTDADKELLAAKGSVSIGAAGADKRANADAVADAKNALITLLKHIREQLMIYSL
nr:hypothetical protein [Tanacetum cinerariifolium]